MIEKKWAQAHLLALTSGSLCLYLESPEQRDRVLDMGVFSPTIKQKSPKIEGGSGWAGEAAATKAGGAGRARAGRATGG